MAEFDETPELPKELAAILDLEGENALSLLEEKDRTAVRERVIDGYKQDRQSMEDYLRKYDDVLDLAGMKDDKGDKTFPFVGASRIKMPYLAQAAIDFNSRTVPEVINRKNIAKVSVWGTADWHEEQRAKRVASAMNWQLKKGIKNWDKSHDWALLYLPIIGQYFTKKWWENERIEESMITSNRMIFDHDAESFEKAERKSHPFDLCHNDYRSYVVSGYYDPIPEVEARLADRDQPPIEKDLELIESHCTLDLDGDGYCEPYIVTWSEEYNRILRIEARFVESDIELFDGQVYKITGEEFFTQTGFIPNMDKPAVYDGYGTLFYDYLEALNTMMRQLVDAGTLNNVAGSSGFINSNIRTGGRTKKGPLEMVMGQLTPVDVGMGTNLNQSIFTMPFTGPSQGAYQLFENLRDEYRVFTTAAQSVDANPGEAAALYLARLQQALKVPTAIMSRVYAGLSGEFNRIYDLMGRYMSEEDYFAIIDWQPDITAEDEQMFQAALQQHQMAAAQGVPTPPPTPPEILAQAEVSKAEDFNDDPDIIPTADPTMGNEFERLARAEAIRSAAMEKPELYNQYEVEKNFLEQMGESRIEEILPKPSGEPSPQQVIQEQYMQADIANMQAEMQNKASKAQLDKLEMQLRFAKMEPEIDKLESEAAKNWSEIDRNRWGDLLNLIREERGAAAENVSDGALADMSGLSDDELMAIASGA